MSNSHPPPLGFSLHQFCLLSTLSCVSTVWFALLSVSFCHKVCYPCISYSLVHCGPAFIKGGQWSSTRPDMFQEVLYTLHGISDFSLRSLWRRYWSCIETRWNKYLSDVIERPWPVGAINIMGCHPDMAALLDQTFGSCLSWSRFWTSCPPSPGARFETRAGCPCCYREVVTEEAHEGP